MKLHKFSLFMGCLLSGATLFAQSSSLPLANNVVTGRLDNGITYMIRHNATPRHQACFYLVNGIGALAEKPGQHGMAHYLEHEMFQGTQHFPGHAMIDMLERHGVLYGYDINAHTSENETVYTLSKVPTQDPKLLDSCLMVMADWTYALELKDDRIEHERGPILRELAMRDNADTRIQIQWANSLLRGSAYENHDVLGTIADIKAITPEGLRKFYAAWLNPAMVDVVVVGDFDVKQMETALRRILSEAPMGDKSQPRPFFAVPDRDTLNYCVATDKAQQGETAMIVNLIRDTPEAQKSSADYLVKTIMARMINIMGATRMSQIAHEQGSPFAGASLAVMPLKRGYFTYQIGAGVGQSGNESRTVRMLLLEYERLKQVGFTQAEFDKAKAQMLSDNEQSTFVSKTNDEVAKMLEQHFLEGEPIVDYKALYPYERAVLDTLSLSSVNALMRSWSTDKNMSVILTGPDGLDYPSKQDILDIFDQVKKINYKGFAFELKSEAPLPEFSVSPKPGRIKKEVVDKAKNTTTWKLANGATVVYKQVPEDRSKVCLRAVRPGGESMFSLQELPSAQVATTLVQAGGVGQLSSQQLNRVQEAKGFKVEPHIYGYSERMEGTSLPNSVEQMMQLTYLRFMQSILDTTLINGSMKQNRIYAHFPMRPQQRLQDAVAQLRSGNNPRVLSQHGDYFDNITANSIGNAWDRCFASANGYTFIITGAQPASELKPLVEKYIASINGGGKPTKWVDNKMYGYQGVTERTVQTGAMGSYAMVVLGVSAPLPYSPVNELTNRIVARVFQQRAMDVMREKDGDVYTINVNEESNAIPRGSFEVSAEFQADTLRASELRDKVYGIWEQMVKGGITQEELTKALAYFQKSYLEDGDKADKWADKMANEVIDGCDLLTAGNYAESAKQVTVATVNAFVRQMDKAKNIVKLIIR